MANSGDPSSMTLNLKSNNITSAPVSPARGVSGLLSRATSLTGSVTSTVQQQIARATSQVAAVIKERHKIILIIDDHLVDWSKYFRARRLIGDWDVKVEQAEFKDLNITANSELGSVISIHTLDRSGFKIARTFRPDFVLIRQHMQEPLNQNYSDIIVGLKYGLVPAINSLQSFYNFQDKAWVFANLLAIQRKQGKDNFPLIEQTFHQSYKDSSGVPKLPCVIKIGSSSNGLGKVKVETINQYQDIRSILMITNTYCTIEPFIEAKCDFIVQKIGTNYKVFSRKSVSGNWKANVGSSLLEQMPFNDRYKKWIDDVSEAFGGLDICSLEGVIAKDGKEYILKVRGSDMVILGDTQEEDRKNIVELIVQRMNAICKNILIKQQSRTSITQVNEFDQNEMIQGKRSSITSMPPSSAPPPPPTAQPGQVDSRRSSRGADPSIQPPLPTGNRPLPAPPPPTQPMKPIVVAGNVPPAKPPPPPAPQIPVKTITDNPTNPFAGFATEDPLTASSVVKPALTKRDSQNTIDEIKEVDDTMKNLRKTFAGIFGDM